MGCSAGCCGVLLSDLVVYIHVHAGMYKHHPRGCELDKGIVPQCVCVCAVSVHCVSVHCVSVHCVSALCECALCECALCECAL